MSYIEEGLYFVFAEIVQLGERQTEDLKFPGSIRRARTSSE